MQDQTRQKGVHVMLLSDGGEVEVVATHPCEQDGLVRRCMLQLLLQHVEQHHRTILQIKQAVHKNKCSIDGRSILNASCRVVNHCWREQRFARS